MTKREAYDEIVLDLRSTGKYTEPEIKQQVTEGLRWIPEHRIEAFMNLYRHNRVTVKP